MSEEKKSIPKPSIKVTPPVSPPTTMMDAEPVKKVEVTEEEVVEEVAANPNGVETDLTKRFLGVLIDGGVAFVLASVAGKLTGSDLLYYLVWAGAILLRDCLPILDGQSLGKKVMKTRAVKEDGSSLSGDWATGATRNLLFAVPFIGLVECFVILSRSGNPEAGTRIGDDWAKTKVISVE